MSEEGGNFTFIILISVVATIGGFLFGFDSGVEFPPHNLRGANINEKIDFYAPFSGNVMDFGQIASSYLEREYAGNRVFKSVFPDFQRD